MSVILYHKFGSVCISCLCNLSFEHIYNVVLLLLSPGHRRQFSLNRMFIQHFLVGGVVFGIIILGSICFLADMNPSRYRAQSILILQQNWCADTWGVKSSLSPV